MNSCQDFIVSLCSYIVYVPSVHIWVCLLKRCSVLCCSPLHTATFNNRHIQHMRLAGFKLPEGRMNTWKSVLFNRKNSFCLCFPFFLEHAKLHCCSMTQLFFWLFSPISSLGVIYCYLTHWLVRRRRFKMDEQQSHGMISCLCHKVPQEWLLKPGNELALFIFQFLCFKVDWFFCQ